MQGIWVCERDTKLDGQISVWVRFSKQGGKPVLDIRFERGRKATWPARLGIRSISVCRDTDLLGLQVGKNDIAYFRYRIRGDRLELSSGSQNLVIGDGEDILVLPNNSAWMFKRAKRK
jgi:hypothetical protein